MGAKLVKNTTPGLVNCTTDKECWAANTSLSVTEATTDTEKAKRCCARYFMIDAGKESSSKATADSLYLQGFPKENFTYTKVCNYNYKTEWSTAKHTQKTDIGGYFLYDDNKNIYEINCDGGATALIASVTAVAAITVSMN